MNLREAGALFFLRPRVVHSIPGRLRLHVPSLKQWGQGNGTLVSMIAQLLAVPEGINEISPCAVTGNVLIRYDPSRLSEGELLALAQSLFRIATKDRDALAKAWEKEPERLQERLSEWLQGAVSRRLYLDGDMRIPEDVFE